MFQTSMMEFQKTRNLEDLVIKSLTTTWGPKKSLLNMNHEASMTPSVAAFKVLPDNAEAIVINNCRTATYQMTGVSTSLTLHEGERLSVTLAICRVRGMRRRQLNSKCRGRLQK